MNARARLRHIVVLCHPEADSFNAAVAAKYCETVRKSGQQAILRDLYRMNFDPVLKGNERPGSRDFAIAPSIAQELELISDAAVLVFIYPIWFGTAPAMLKGYVERVLGSGFSFRSVRDRDFHDVLSGVHLLSFTSSGNTKPWLEEQGAWLSLLNVFDQYLEKAFSMIAADHVHFPSVVDGLKERFVLENLEQVRQAARKMCSIAANERNRADAAAMMGGE